MFQLEVDPASMTIGEGIDHAVRLLARSWRSWLPAIVAVAVIGGIGNSIINAQLPIVKIDVANGRPELLPGWGHKIPVILAASFTITVAEAILGWFFLGVAIGGLRRRPVTLDWVVARGLRSFVASLLLGLIFFVGAICVIIPIALVPPLGLVLLPIAMVMFVYVAIRFAFSGLAIFDGAGPIEGLAASWRLSDRAVIRLIGWGLMAALIGIGFGIAANIIAGPLSFGPAIIKQGLSFGIQSIGTGFVTCLFAMQYASQLARTGSPKALAP